MPESLDEERLASISLVAGDGLRSLPFPLPAEPPRPTSLRNSFSIMSFLFMPLPASVVLPGRAPARRIGAIRA